jgi:hypothetical protein
MRLDDILPTVEETEPVVHRHFMDGGYASLLFDDAAAGVLLWSITSGLGVFGLRLATCVVNRPALGKAITAYIKSLGGNGRLEGAVLCELNCLAGRAVGELDAKAEICRRAVPSLAKSDVCGLDPEEVRAWARVIIRSELGSAPEFAPIDEFWARRWAWCVNGSHSRIAERELGDERVTVAEPGRVHRRVFVEGVSHNVLEDWKPRVFYSYSEKLEAGKTRALFAGDSLSYIAFEHLLRPVERVWLNKRVLLDPGSGGSCEMSERVRRLVSSNTDSVYVMLDYDDFNSQHSLEMQQMLFEELIAETNYDKILGMRILDSFKRGRIYWGDKSWKHVSGLMSGHRATTFVNSVLNRAYMCAASSTFRDKAGLHVGDDVVSSARSVSEAFSILRECEASGLRMNPLKQSVGRHCGEFLRVATGAKDTCGYLARAIGGAVAGNWVRDYTLQPSEALASMINAGWTIYNRSGGYPVGLLLSGVVNRLTGGTFASERLMCGVTGLGPGPVRLGDADYVERTYVEENWKVDLELADKAKKATEAYLRDGLAPVEGAALEMAKTGITTRMVELSYSKTILSSVAGEGVMSELCLRDVHAKAPRCVDIGSLLRMQDQHGLLEKYPLVMLVRSSLGRGDLRRLLDMVSDEWDGDPEEAAFGRDRVDCAVRGFVPYSDAAMLSRRAGGATVVAVHRQYYL